MGRTLVVFFCFEDKTVSELLCLSGALSVLIYPLTLYNYVILALTRKICGILSKKLQKLALFKY